MAYSGQTFNGNFAGDENNWQTLLKPYNIEFTTLTAGAWHDLSSIDVLIAIRSFDTKPHNTKPPTKLFSAWHANIPFIGGYDSAFMQVGAPGEDYILSKTQVEVLEAVLKLKNDPELYEGLVERGRKKALLYNENSIAETWEKILAGPIMQRYQKWKSRKFSERIRFNILLKLGIFKHRGKQQIKRIVNVSK